MDPALPSGGLRQYFKQYDYVMHHLGHEQPPNSTAPPEDNPPWWSSDEKTTKGEENTGDDPAYAPAVVKEDKDAITIPSFGIGRFQRKARTTHNQSNSCIDFSAALVRQSCDLPKHLLFDFRTLLPADLR